LLGKRKPVPATIRLVGSTEYARLGGVGLGLGAGEGTGDVEGAGVGDRPPPDPQAASTSVLTTNVRRSHLSM
jgi:hypothetical protein